jgi:hypothetical protein
LIALEDQVIINFRSPTFPVVGSLKTMLFQFPILLMLKETLFLMSKSLMMLVMLSKEILTFLSMESIFKLVILMSALPAVLK